MRRASRRDDNEAAIVEALELVGVDVVRLSAKGLPDLLCARGEDLKLLEVKQRRGRLTKAQAEMRAKLPFTVVRSVEQALALFGIG